MMQTVTQWSIGFRNGTILNKAITRKESFESESCSRKILYFCVLFQAFRICHSVFYAFLLVAEGEIEFCDAKCWIYYIPSCILIHTLFLWFSIVSVRSSRCSGGLWKSSAVNKLPLFSLLLLIIHIAIFVTNTF